jgi:hypothetical protein
VTIFGILWVLVVWFDSYLSLKAFVLGLYLCVAHWPDGCEGVLKLISIDRSFSDLIKCCSRFAYTIFMQELKFHDSGPCLADNLLVVTNCTLDGKKQGAVKARLK